MLEMKHRDTPTVRWAILGAKGAPVDVSSANATLHMRQGAAPPLSFALTVVDGPAGIVEHTFDGTLPPGPYRYEIEIMRDGAVATAPTVGTAEARVWADIGQGMS